MGLSDSVVILLLGLALIVDIGGGEESVVEECLNALGMESGKIPSSQITASSSFDVKSVGPQNARIREELNGGAWCPKVAIQQGVKEFLEIDFAGEHRITQTETQGRFGGGYGREYTESFQLEYWRDALSRWIPYKDYLGRTIMEGNTNTYLETKQQLIPPIIASRIRFIPHSVHPRTICMRVEAYGCHYGDGVVHYEAPQGYYQKNPEVDFRDVFYDGKEDESGILRSGHGLLTDTLLGPNDFTSPHKSRGNTWIGWDNQSTPIKIGFQFDQLRKFQLVSIHVNNFVSQGAQVFASVNIYLSMDGLKFSDYPISWTPKKDLKNETGILETVPLKGRLATYIRLEFFHSNHWLLFSEISFRSDIFTGNISDEIHSMNYHQDSPDGQFSQKNKSVTTNGTPEHSTGAIIGLVIGSVSVCLLLSVVSVACFLMRRNRRNTKLVGVIGMTPKSMSIGLGLSNCPSNDQLSISTKTSTTTKGNKKKPSGGSSTTTTTLNGGGIGVLTMGGSGGKKLGKIALCDMKPVSMSGETDSDESLYHELVFGRSGPSQILMGKPSSNSHSSSNGGCGTNNKNKKSFGGGGGGSGLSYSSLGIANISSVGSSCTSTGKTESDSGYGSCSQQLGRKGCGIGSRKIKYQKVNHGADFSDVMGVRGIEDEMTYYHIHNQNLSNHFQPSSPSTPSGQMSSNKVPLGQSLTSISTSTSVHIPPSPPIAFRIPFLAQHPQISYSSNPNNNPHLTLGHSGHNNHKNNNAPIIFPSSTNGRGSVGGFYNSPRVSNPRRVNNNNNNHHSGSINTISAALSLNNGPVVVTNGIGSGNNNSSANTTPANSFGVSSLMKSSGLSTSSSSNHHLLPSGGSGGGPLGICGPGESNYYAATDIFQVSDKHFDRF